MKPQNKRALCLGDGPSIHKCGPWMILQEEMIVLGWVVHVNVEVMHGLGSKMGLITKSLSTHLYITQGGRGTLVALAYAFVCSKLSPNL